MKKTLLLLLSVSFAQLSIGQTFLAEDFSSYTVGNVGTDLTGVTPGQGNYLTTATNGADPTSTTNTDNSNFQFVDAGGSQGMALQIIGPNGDKGNRFIWQEGLGTVWAMRTAGNDILEMEIDLYTGSATSSKNNVRFYIYDATKTKILGGFYFDLGTKTLSGVAYYDATAQVGGQIANYLFYLGTPFAGQPTNVVYPAETWQRIGVSYNYTTGQVKWKGPSFNPGSNTMGAAAMTNPDEINLIMVSGSNLTATPPVVNVGATMATVDNIVVRASATDTLLGVSDVVAVTEFASYPNPVGNILSLVNGVGMKSVQITDLNGRIVKSEMLGGTMEAEINVSDLTSGMYIMNVSAENGTVTKKIIKN